LLTESNHPPLCSRSLVDAVPLTRRNGGMEAYVSVYGAIASALLGASIPAVYGLSRLAFRPQEQLAAAMMVSTASF